MDKGERVKVVGAVTAKAGTLGAGLRGGGDGVRNKWVEFEVAFDSGETQYVAARYVFPEVSGKHHGAGKRTR